MHVVTLRVPHPTDRGRVGLRVAVRHCGLVLGLVDQLRVAALCARARPGVAPARGAVRELAILALHVESVFEEVHVVIVAATLARADHGKVSVEGLVVLGVGAVEVPGHLAQQVDLLLPLEERVRLAPLGVPG